MGQNLMEVDFSAILRPGVYVLRHKGRVVYVGQSECPLIRVYTHKRLREYQRLRGSKGRWRGIRAIIFDAVALIPANVGELRRIEKELIEKYRPEYNTQLKPKIDLDELLASLGRPKVKIELENRV